MERFADAQLMLALVSCPAGADALGGASDYATLGVSGDHCPS
jgi:hypothetical protein